MSVVALGVALAVSVATAGAVGDTTQVGATKVKGRTGLWTLAQAFAVAVGVLGIFFFAAVRRRAIEVVFAGI